MYRRVPFVPVRPFSTEPRKEDASGCDEKPGEEGEDDVGEDEVFVLRGVESQSW